MLLFRHHITTLTIEDISQQLHIPQSTVYRYMRVLSDHGFIEKSGSSSYRLGLAFLELGRTALNSNRDLKLRALPAMERIARTCGESVSLMRRFNDRVICIENIEGRYALRVAMEPGRTQPIYAGASSKLLLAYLPAEEQDQLLQTPMDRLTTTTITNADQLREELQRIRQQGFAVSDGEIDSGARAVAVPVYDGRDMVVAALSIEAPATRMDDAAVVAYRDLLLLEAKQIRREFK